MNQKILFVVPISVLVAACAQQEMADEGECLAAVVPMNCTGSYSNPKLGITLVVNGIKVGPPNLCAHPGANIEVSIQPPNQKVGSVKTVPKDPANTWINGTNDPDPKGFILEVPDDIGVKTNFDYTIVRANGVCLDPRFEVDPGG